MCTFVQKNVRQSRSDSRHFNEWYERQVTAVRTYTPTGANRDDSPLRQLTAVRTAVDDVLKPTEWGRIDWDQAQGCVVAEHPVQGRLPLSALSSGVRNMIAVAADLGVVQE
jgi:predicted ATP-binding protein involved in virulence